MRMDIIKKLTQSAVAVLPEGELEKKLKTGKKLRIKLGMDPTAPDLHLGHAVVLRKLKDFQDAGHEVIFLIGDFTARIGDPSGKSKTRPPLTSQEIAANTKTYFEQVGRILNKESVRVVYNSEWLSQLGFDDIVKLCAKVTVARITQRDDFAKRLQDNVAIGMHELLYPLMQGYDSVALDADVELGGTDQTFNVLMGRFLQEQFQKPAQVIMTLPLLEGLDGHEKMSKSLGNYIGLSEAPEKAYGKLMSISDALMWRYFEVLVRLDQTAIDAKKNALKEATIHPIDIKKEMAHAIVAEFWSLQDADTAQKHFEAVFQNKDLSQGKEVVVPAAISETVWIVDLLRALQAVASSSEAKRLLESGAVTLDGVVIKEFKAEVLWKNDSTLKVGKHRVYVLKRS